MDTYQVLEPEPYTDPNGVLWAKACKVHEFGTNYNGAQEFALKMGYEFRMNFWDNIAVTVDIPKETGK